MANLGEYAGMGQLDVALGSWAKLNRIYLT